MKRLLTTLVITSSAIISIQAQAVEIYKNNGTTLSAIGDISVNFEKGTQERLDLQNYSTSIFFKLHQKLSDNVLAAGGIKIGTYSNLSSTSPYVSKYYIGFQKPGIGTITFGRTPPNGIRVQLGNYTNGYGGNNNLNADIQGFGWKAINVISDSFSGFSFGGDYIFGDKNKQITQNDYGKLKHAYGLQEFYSHRFSNNTILNINSGYNTLININPTANINDKLYGLAEDISQVLQLLKSNSAISHSWLTSAEIIKNNLSVGGSYGQTHYEQFHYYDNAHREHIGNFKMTAFLLGANYNLTKLDNIYLQYQRNTAAKTFKQNVYIIGDGYQLNNHISTFIEGAHFDTHAKAGNIVGNYLAVGFSFIF